MDFKEIKAVMSWQENRDRLKRDTLYCIWITGRIVQKTATDHADIVSLIDWTARKHSKPQISIPKGETYLSMLADEIIDQIETEAVDAFESVKRIWSDDFIRQGIIEDKDGDKDRAFVSVVSMFSNSHTFNRVLLDATVWRNAEIERIKNDVKSS